MLKVLINLLLFHTVVEKSICRSASKKVFVKKNVKNDTPIQNFLAF